MSRLLMFQVIAAALTATTTGCGVIGMSEVDQVRDPLSPQQAKTQVIEAAREAVALLGIRPSAAWVGLSSCNDQGEAPFRGYATVHFPPAASREAADADAAVFLTRLHDAGWDPNPQFHSAAPHAEKNGVTLIIEAQAAEDTVRILSVLGACRDIATTKQTRGSVERFDL